MASTNTPSSPKKDSTQPKRVAPKSPHAISESERMQAFHDTMRQAQGHMNPPQKLFSRTLHSRPVRIISDVIGSTLARPTALLSGVLISIIATTIMYIPAKYYGYTLSGSEPLVAFGAGWIVGIIIEYTQMLVRGGRLKNRRS
ncbi:hypothetical protein I8H83_04700 [Candidatus Saccharibacteria bacterium]|nr:hypothetical protein [Candidatus Saccharibacteria bacterium]